LLKLVTPPSGVEQTFPKLRRLIIDEDHGASWNSKVYTAFLSPALISLSIPYQRDGDPIMWRRLPNQCPRLQVLEVTDTVHGLEPVPQQVVHAIANLPPLKRVSCADLDARSLLRVSQLPNIRHLSLTTMHLDLSPPSNKQLLFPFLETLEISTSNLPHAHASLLALIRSLSATPTKLAIKGWHEHAEGWK